MYFPLQLDQIMAYLVDHSMKVEEQSQTVFGLCQTQPEVLEAAWMAETIALMVLILVFIPWFYYLLLRKCDKIRRRRTERRTEAILAEHQGRQNVVATMPSVLPVSPPVSVAVAAAPAVLPMEAPVQVQERAPAVIIEYDHGYGARPRQRPEAVYVEQPPPYRYGAEVPQDFRPMPSLRANPFSNQRLFEMNIPRLDRHSRRMTRVISRDDIALALRGPEVNTVREGSDHDSERDA